MVSIELFKRILFYGLTTLFLGSLQCAFFPLLNFCPATPDLLLAMLVAIALLDSPKSAAICAVACGFFIDAIGGVGISFSPLIYFSAVLIISFFTEKILEGLPAFLLLLLPSLLCRATWTYLCIAAAERHLPAATVFSETIIPEAVCTALLAVPVYFLVKLCSIPLQRHGKFNFR